MKKRLFFVYALICYLAFQAAFVWGVAFTGVFVPEALRAAAAPPGLALLIDLGLIALFGVQHSVMARAAFKRRLARLAPAPIERSTYVLLASLALLLLFWQWRPLPGAIWHVQHPSAQALIWGLWGLGWLTALISTFLIDHFDLVGLRQAYNQLRDIQPGVQALKTPALYRLVRHPMMLGLLIAFWATPHMTTGHLLFALGMTVYILIGVSYEERDLLLAFGEAYRAYRRRVPMLIPLPRGGQAARQREHAHSE